MDKCDHMVCKSWQDVLIRWIGRGLLVLVILASDTPVHPNLSPWLNLFLLCPLVCLMMELIIRRYELPVTKLLLGFVIAFMLIGNRKALHLGLVYFPLSTVLFVILCLCFISQLRFLRVRLPRFLPWAAALIVLPLFICMTLTSSKYGFESSLLRNILSQGLMLGVTILASREFLRFRSCVLAVLVALLGKCLMNVVFQ